MNSHEAAGYFTNDLLNVIRLTTERDVAFNNNLELSLSKPELGVVAACMIYLPHETARRTINHMYPSLQSAFDKFISPSEYRALETNLPNYDLSSINSDLPAFLSNFRVADELNILSGLGAGTLPEAKRAFANSYPGVCQYLQGVAAGIRDKDIEVCSGNQQLRDAVVASSLDETTSEHVNTALVIKDADIAPHAVPLVFAAAMRTDRAFAAVHTNIVKGVVCAAFRTRAERTASVVDSIGRQIDADISDIDESIRTYTTEKTNAVAAEISAAYADETQNTERHVAAANIGVLLQAVDYSSFAQTGSLSRLFFPITAQALVKAFRQKADAAQRSSELAKANSPLQFSAVAEKGLLASSGGLDAIKAEKYKNFLMGYAPKEAFMDDYIKADVQAPAQAAVDTAGAEDCVGRYIGAVFSGVPCAANWSANKKIALFVGGSLAPESGKLLEIHGFGKDTLDKSRNYFRSVPDAFGTPSEFIRCAQFIKLASASSKDIPTTHDLMNARSIFGTNAIISSSLGVPQTLVPTMAVLGYYAAVHPDTEYVIPHVFDTTALHLSNVTPKKAHEIKAGVAALHSSSQSGQDVGAHLNFDDNSVKLVHRLLAHVY